MKQTFDLYIDIVDAMKSTAQTAIDHYDHTACDNGVCGNSETVEALEHIAARCEKLSAAIRAELEATYADVPSIAPVFRDVSNHDPFAIPCRYCGSDQHTSYGHVSAQNPAGLTPKLSIQLVPVYAQDVLNTGWINVRGMSPELHKEGWQMCAHGWPIHPNKSTNCIYCNSTETNTPSPEHPDDIQPSQTDAL